jgi:hypothetical protein
MPPPRDSRARYTSLGLLGVDPTPVNSKTLPIELTISEMLR